MTAALLTSTFERKLRTQGFYLVKCENENLLMIYQDSVMALLNDPYHPTNALRLVGNLSYKNGAVDYDKLQQIIGQSA